MAESEDSGHGANAPSESKVDARLAQGVQVGDHNYQLIYNYRGTWSDGVAPAPLISVRGEIDSPYRGLGWFTERDAAFFFGRDSATDAVLQRLSESALRGEILLVSGVSGAGKTSLLRAGVLPRLRGEGLAGVPGAHDWPYLVVTPGRAPLDELALATAELGGLDAATIRRELHADPTAFAVSAAQAVRKRSGAEAGGRLLLVVDQFEQLFTRCSDLGQRQAFVTAVHAAATSSRADSGVVVVLIVRADFETRCADFEHLTDAIQHRYLVTAMTQRQLRTAITEPAKKADSRIEDELCEQLLREIRTRTGVPTVSVPVESMSAAGVLPLLSYALDRAWRTRAGDTVTIADYERGGGIQSAVADSAQRAYDSLTSSQQERARQIFTRLTIVGLDGTETADRVRRVDLSHQPGDAGEVDAVLETFAAERLLTLSADGVEISHEALLTSWPLLRDTWLAESRDIRAVCTRLRVAAAEWERHSRDVAYLYSGSVLETATSAADRVTANPSRFPALGHLDEQFLAVATRAQQRRARLRRGLVGILMILVVALTASMLVTLRANRDVTHQRDIAIADQLVGRSESLAATDPFGSRFTALAAWRINPTPAARHAMLAAAHNPRSGVLENPGSSGLVVLSPDGSILASPADMFLVGEESDWAVVLWDVKSRNRIGDPLTGHTSSPRSVAFAPDGTVVATGGQDGIVRLWDARTSRQIGDSFTGHAKPIRSVDFSPDGAFLATAAQDGRVLLWNVKTRSRIGDPIEQLYDVSFNPTDTTLATAGYDGTVRLWDARTGQQIDELAAESAQSVSFSPDGALLVTAGKDGAVRLWDVKSRTQIGDAVARYAAGPSAPVVALSPDGRLLAIKPASGDRLQLWDVGARRQIGSELVTGHGGSMTFSFSSSSGTLVTAGEDGLVRVWDVGTGNQIGEPLTGHTTPIVQVASSPDGSALATGGSDGTIRLWDLRTGLHVGVPFMGNTERAYSAKLSPDGAIVATTSFDRAVRLWDTKTHRQIGDPLDGQTDGVSPAVFSPDGAILVAARSDRSVRLWDTRTRRTIGDLITGHTDRVTSIVFSPDSTILATASYDRTVRLWDLRTRQQIGRPLDGHADGVYQMGFSSDSTTLLTVGLNQTVRRWDARTGSQIGNPVTGPTDMERPSDAGWLSPDVAYLSPDSTILASFDRELIRLWDTRTGREIGQPLTGHTAWGLLAVFSPDNATLASTGWDGTIRVWDLQAGRQIGSPLAGDGSFVAGMAFSTDGATLATTSRRGEIRLWDVATSRLIGDSLVDYAKTAGPLAFSPDGASLLSAGYNGRMRLWDVRFTADVETWLCAWADGAFTRSKWEEYVPPGPKYRELCS